MAPNIVRSDASETPARGYPTSPFRLFEDFFNNWAARSLEGRRSEGWTPAVDVMEKEGNLMLMISLPGLSEKEIELKIEGQVLTVQGERKIQEGYTYHQTESSLGAFSRSFTLPDSADLEAIKADYKNGILTVTIPPKAEIKPRSIKVNV